jgi:vacuolar protein sorting-associated protein 13D
MVFLVINNILPSIPFQSTTVLSYRPFETNKVMSINLNNLEVFSCVLDAEEETALSIIDPVTINLDIKKGILEVSIVTKVLAQSQP